MCSSFLAVNCTLVPGYNIVVKKGTTWDSSGRLDCIRLDWIGLGWVRLDAAIVG